MTVSNRQSPEELDREYAEFVFDRLLDTSGNLEEYVAIKQITYAILEEIYEVSTIEELDRDELKELRSEVVNVWCRLRQQTALN